MRGRIVRGVGGFYYVETEGGLIYACRARGIFRKDKVKPLPGDTAEFTVTHEEDREGNLTQILPRKNALIRPAVSGVDQALLFFSVCRPDPSTLLLDRYLLMLGQQDLPALLCFNKVDIAGPGEKERLEEVYSKAGYPLFFVSVKTGEGTDALLNALAGKTTVLAGPSGAGKSSLINHICPAAEAETGELSRKLARGKNTTRHSELFRIGQAAGSCDSWLIDTPGFTALMLPDTRPEELVGAYAEFQPFRGRCRFATCMHDSEPDCAVRQEVEQGRICAERYENYRKLLKELKDREENRYR